MSRAGALEPLSKAVNFLGKKKGTYSVTTCLCNLIGSFCYNIVLAIVMQKVLDGVAYQNKAALLQGVAFAVGSFLVAFLFEPILSRVRSHCVRSTVSGIRQKLFSAVINLSVREYEGMEQGDVITAASSDIETVGQIYLGHIPNLCFAVIHGGIASVLMLAYNVWLGVISLAIGLLQAAVNYKMSKKIMEAADARQQCRAELLQEVVDTIDGKQDIAAFHAMPFFEGKFLRQNRAFMDRARQVRGKQKFAENMDNLFENINNVAVLAIGLYMALRGSTTLGTVAAVIHLQGNAEYLFHNLSAFMSGIAEALPSLNRVCGLMQKSGLPEEASAQAEADTEADTKADADTETAKQRCGETAALAMRNVSFEYERNQPILHDLNFVIEKGTLTVITGRSGVGKSTWLKILLGFYRPGQGSYLLQGRDTARLSAAEIQEQIAYVDQECFLFRMSVRENVRMGCPTASDEAVVAACKAASAHDFITGLPEGYDTLMLNGENLSGGQKQRIALARAFISERPVLLIDEGTANLDPESEQKVIESVVRMKGEKTVLVISHNAIWEAYADTVYRLH